MPPPPSTTPTLAITPITPSTHLMSADISARNAPSDVRARPECARSSGGGAPAPGRARARAVVVGVLLLTVLLTACGVRLETPPPEVPEAGVEEEVRQRAALTATAIHEAASAALADPSAQGASGADLRTALLAAEAAATVHHQALGGMWEPWPGAGPEATAYPTDGVTNGSGTTTAPPAAGSPSPGELLDLLEGGAREARQAALAHPGDLGRLLASLAISRTFLAADLAAALSAPAEPLSAEPLSEPAPGTIDPATSRAVDGARYAMEIVAARSSDEQRDTARARAAHLLRVAEAVAPEHDTREVAYDIGDVAAGEGTTSERALAAAAELDVVGAYLHLLGTDWPDREAALAAATHAAAQVRAWDGVLPVLPGLA